MGLVGALTPTSCKFQEVANGDSLITMEHPKDDFGRYAALEKGNILIVPVPVRTTPEIQNGSCVTTVWTYKVKPLDQLTSASQRTLYKKSTGSGKMKVMQAGDVVTVVSKPPTELGSDRWKAKTKYGTGWIDPNGVELITEHKIDNNANAIEEIQSPWTITPQIFRIYETTKNLDSITVSARHITYDLNYDICHWLVGAENSVSLQYAINQILACGYTDTSRFSVYTNVANEKIGGRYRAKTIIGAYLDAEDGVCAQYNVCMVRDNHDMYFLHDPGINRGVRLQYSKNLTGITFKSSDDEVITRIVPIGEYENGLELGIGDTVATQYIDTPNASKYPIKHVCYYKCNNAKVGQKDTNGGKVTIEIARARMRKQAQDLIDNGCDLPKIEMEVEFVNLGDTVEYAQYKNLENAFLFDYVIVQHPDFNIDVTARIVEINWDCLLDRMVSSKIGSVGETIANTGIASWQIPTGFSGSKIGDGTISSGALSDGIINARHVQAESINTDALQAGCVTAIKIAANAITADKLDADTVDAKIANIVLANLTTANIQNANISWADIETLNAAIANISKAHINDADIDWANITKLTAVVGEIAVAKIQNATISTAQIDNLAAVIASAVHLEVQTGNFTLAEIKNLLSNALILQEGVADSMMITNLAVTSANLLNATIDKLVLRGSDGKYYRVFIGADGTIQTEEVTVTEGEIAAGETGDGRQIVATTANVGSLNATTVKASQAIIGTIFTESLTAGKITANEALIASMTAPLLYTTAITALGNSLDLSANESIRLTVGSSLATATVEYALSDSRTEAPETGWSATAPEWTDGKYMWQRTTWTKRDGTKTVSDPTCIAGATGAKGEDGTGIASVTAEYYLSTSKDEPTGGEWLETPPTWTTGKYMWTRTKIVYKNPPSTETTEPVCDSTWEITNGLKDDIDAVSNAAETALGLAEVAQDAANGAQETANGAQDAANQANERASILETQLTLTQEGLSIVRTETIPGLEGRVETIESGVHIAGSEIGIYTSDSPFRNTITNNGWVISEDGAPIITCAETKLTAPRVMVSDAFIIGGLAWKPGTDKHVRLLKYGRLS
nr:MAG TPA: tail protein [Caudoviricetes sp.]